MNILVIIQRVIQEILRDKRTLALMLFAPLMMISLIHFVFDSTSETTLQLAVDQKVPQSFIRALPKDKIKVHPLTQATPTAELRKNPDLSAVLTVKDQQWQLYFENSDPNVTAQTKAIVQTTLTRSQLGQMQQFISQVLPKSQAKQPKLQFHYLYGKADSTYFDKIFPIFIAFLVFFFVFLISGIALLRERQSGTLTRLLMTPIRRSELVLGYLLGFGLFAILQTILLVLFSIYLLHAHLQGSLLLVVGINVLTSFAALSMGLFISTFANSEFQMMQFIPVVVIPQLLFSGIIPLDSLAKWAQNIGAVLPLSYAGDALSRVMIKGAGIADVAFDLFVLGLFILIFTLLNILGLKKYRQV